MPRPARWLAACLVIAFLALGAASGFYAVNHLGFQSDTRALLSPDLPFRQEEERYRRQFPMNDADLLLAVEAPTPEQAQAAAADLSRSLREHTDAVTDVRHLRGGSYFERNAFLFLETGELADLSQRLIRAQPLLGQLAGDPTVRGLFNLLVLIDRSDRLTDEATLVAVTGRIEQVMAAQIAGRDNTLSWQRIIQNKPTDNRNVARALIVARTLSGRGLSGTDDALDAVQAAWVDVGESMRASTALRISGSAVMARDELRTLASESRIGAPLVLLAVTGILGLGLRSLRLALAAWVVLIVGLLVTAALAALLIGHLNLISVAFGLLYLGLSVDFAIHWLMRYRIERHHGVAVLEAIGRTYRTTGVALSLCALTTAAGFLAFVPTGFVGVAELGIIAAAGMGISLLLTLTLLPAMLLLERDHFDRARPLPTQSRLAAFTWFPAHHRGAVVAVALVFLLPAILLAPRVRFDADPINLRDPDTEAVRLLRDLRAEENAGHFSATVLADGPGEAREIAERLRALPEVGRAITLEQLIPENTQAKLVMIDELALVVGPAWSDTLTNPPTFQPDEQLVAIRDAAEAMNPSNGATEGDKDAAGAEMDAAGKGAPQVFTGLHDALTRWLAHYDTLGPQDRSEALRSLNQRLMGTFPIAMRQLQTALSPDPTVPQDLRRRWISGQGVHRIEVLPASIPQSNADLQRFADVVQSVAPTATGPAVIRAEAGRAIVRAFVEATGYALIAIIVILLVQLRSVRHTAAVLMPLILAGVMLMALMVLLEVPFNFANVIAIPLLLGAGVDNGIHMVVRSRHGGSRRAGLMATTTARAILLSAVTTLCAFITMALSNHPGTASMGLLLTLGLVLILLNTLVLLPALLHNPEATAHVIKAEARAASVEESASARGRS